MTSATSGLNRKCGLIFKGCGMKRFEVRSFVSANFGTLSGWSSNSFDTLAEAVEKAGMWDLIVDHETGEEKIADFYKGGRT